MRTHDRPTRLADINREACIYAGAGATVAWQLALPGVGRGVARHSSTLDRPLQRLQATMAYVYAVSLGNEADRAAIAAHVNRAHRPVRGEGYSAFDRDLQLWVAATLYRGAVDVHELFVGPLPVARREALYRDARAFGSTLQVREEQWPPTAADFEIWWQAQRPRLQVDDQVRHYFQAVLAGGRSPWYLRPALPLQSFFTRGLLPPFLRQQFGLAWTATDQARWQRVQHWAPRLYWLLPAWLRHWPARHYLRKLRRQQKR